MYDNAWRQCVREATRPRTRTENSFERERERERGEDEATSLARRLKAGVEAKLISGFNYKD